MTILCARHEDALQMALELRGLLRPTLIAEADLTPLTFAHSLILDHAQNFCGSASVEMLRDKHCPICFINRELVRRGGNPVDVGPESWLEHAAEEALEADIARKDGAGPQTVFV